jgi:cytochrome P450
MKAYTFSNGITIPKGTHIFAPLTSIHRDERIYENANKFDGFRFSRMREQEGEKTKHHASSTNPDFLQFGHGPHAWYALFSNLSYSSPGRFFAVNEIKLMLTLFIMRYDVRMKDDIRPDDVKLGPSIAPNLKAEIFLKRRGFPN